MADRRNIITTSDTRAVQQTGETVLGVIDTSMACAVHFRDNLAFILLRRNGDQPFSRDDGPEIDNGNMNASDMPVAEDADIRTGVVRTQAPVSERPGSILRRGRYQSLR